MVGDCYEGERRCVPGGGGAWGGGAGGGLSVFGVSLERLTYVLCQPGKADGRLRVSRAKGLTVRGSLVSVTFEVVRWRVRPTLRDAVQPGLAVRTGRLVFRGSRSKRPVRLRHGGQILPCKNRDGAFSPLPSMLARNFHRTTCRSCHGNVDVRHPQLRRPGAAILSMLAVAHQVEARIRGAVIRCRGHCCRYCVCLARRRRMV